jgi:hypothetical protein
MTTIDKPTRFYDKFDRFDFEQQIMSCWNITTDLKDLTEGMLESDLSKDQICNVLMGLEQLYQLRFDKLFRQFETLVHEHSQSLDRDYVGETFYDDLKTRQEELSF